MVPSRVAWLRLLVTALLCVAGLARPVAERGEASSVRAREPMQASALGRETELTRVRRRGATDPSSDPPAVIVGELERSPAVPIAAAVAAVRAELPKRTLHERAVARGPPLLG